MASIDVELDEAHEQSMWAIIEAIEAKVVEKALKEHRFPKKFKVRYRRFKKLPQHQRKAILDRFGSKTINGKQHEHPGLIVKMRGVRRRMYFKAELLALPIVKPTP